MTEKKTFKNPYDLKIQSRCSSGYNMFVIDEYGDSEVFASQEWDMEVTFTKKVEPLRADERVVDEEGDAATIIAVVRDKAWIKYDMFGHMEEIVELDNLTRIGESDD